MKIKKLKATLDSYNNLIMLVLNVVALTLTVIGLTLTSTSKPIETKSPANQVDTPKKQNGKSTVLDYYEKNERTILYSMAGLFFFVSLVLIFQLRRKKKLKLAVFSQEGRFFRSVKDIMEEFLLKEEISISSIKFTDITHINDVKSMCIKVFYPHRNHLSIEDAITDARKKAYSIKYALPREDDEKIVGRNENGDWEKYLFDLLAELNIHNHKELSVIDVGIGNANTYSNNFCDIKNHIGVDLSNQALSIAKEKIKNLIAIVNEAEDLREIDNSVIDLYLSLRTFQSTLFDRRNALHEARRVLKPGGIIIISLPVLYYTNKEGFVKGLSDASKNISMEYAYFLANSIKKYLEMLCFNKVGIDDKSPYEVFIYGQLEN